MPSHRQHLIKHLACQMSKSISLNSCQILENCFVHFEGSHVIFQLSLESLHLAKNQESYGLMKLCAHTENSCMTMQASLCAGMCRVLSIFLNFQAMYLIHFSINFDDSKIIVKLIIFSTIGSNKNAKRTCHYWKA